MMIPIGAIVAWFDGRRNQIVGEIDDSVQIFAPRAIAEAKNDHITFATTKVRKEFESLLHSTESKLILVDKQLFTDFNLSAIPAGKTLIVSQDPKADIIAFCAHFLDFQKLEETGSIHASAEIAADVILGKGVNIGAFAVIGQGCKIGDYATIGSGTSINNAELGRYVEIGTNSAIGGTGFGYAKMKDSDAYTQFPHYGRVLIHDCVSIGSNTCIDRGSLSDTVIEEGVKIDNLVHIAHNVKIGRNSLVIACSMVAGSTVIGENCWIAPSSTIRNAVVIGRNATVGLAATVTKDVEENQTVMGSPGMDMADFLDLRKAQKAAITALRGSPKE